MDKKVTRRIIGVLVVFALVIIMLPLLFNTNVTQSPLQTAEIKSPPFPDKYNAEAGKVDAAQNVAAAKAGEVMQKVMADKAEVASVVPSVEDLKVSLQPLLQADAGDTAVVKKPAKQAPAAIMAKKASKSNAVAQTVPHAAQNDAHVSLVPAPDEDSVALGADGDATRLTEATIRDDLNQITAEQADVSKLKKTAWVIQMGSFKDKSNANRLANSLRAKGYKAFTYETKRNGQTRVYVGPEGKQMAAASLASKIQEDTNMRGLILTFKPLEL